MTANNKKSRQSKLYILRWSGEMGDAGCEDEGDVEELAGACAIYDQMLLDDAIKYGYTVENGYHLERSIFSTYFMLHHNGRIVDGGLGTALSVLMHNFPVETEE